MCINEMAAGKKESPIDVLDIEFILRGSFTTANNCNEDRSNVSLLAISSSFGLLFVGSPNRNEFKVISSKDLSTASSNEGLFARQVSLPDVPLTMACSSDGNLMAVTYELKGSLFMSVYSVQDLLLPTVKSAYHLALTPEQNVHALQLLWNPVISNIIAVVFDNGALAMFTLKNDGQFELHSLDKSTQVKCACWSPKGKQLVLGLANGKLQQMRPDLTLAKTIICAPENRPSCIIAVHWLSTYQFAAVISNSEEERPLLYIINAPKNAAPTYYDYDDVCFSSGGLREHQFTLIHVSQWNLLLVVSANGIDVGLLGTVEGGDAPTWQQYLLPDNARIEMPLNDMSETYPIGFVLDTSSTHHLTKKDMKLPITMPMVHVLSTDGTLQCFDFVNLRAGAASLCSPPPPIVCSSEHFQSLQSLLSVDTSVQASTTTSAELSFGFPKSGVTSTPNQKQQAVNIPIQENSSQVNLKESTPKPCQNVQTGVTGTANGRSLSVTSTNIDNNISFTSQTKNAEAATQKLISQTESATTSTEPKALYTVYPDFKPPPVGLSTSVDNSESTSTISTNQAINIMMAIEIDGFNKELKQLKKSVQKLFEGYGISKELEEYSKRLNDLQILNEQAKHCDFESDVTILRHSLNECYSMLNECRSKLEKNKNQNVSFLLSFASSATYDKRQIAGLETAMADIREKIQQAERLLDQQWEQYQDILRLTTNTEIKTPNLESIYQRILKAKNCISNQRQQLLNLRCRLAKLNTLQLLPNGTHGSFSKCRSHEGIDCLAESLISLNLSECIQSNSAKLTPKKIEAIREAVDDRAIRIIKPQRPDRIGLRSEVILETKLRIEQAFQDAQSKSFAAQKQKVSYQKASEVFAKPEPMPMKATNSATNSAFNLTKQTESKASSIDKSTENSNSSQASSINKTPLLNQVDNPLMSSTTKTSTTFFTGLGKKIEATPGSFTFLPNPNQSKPLTTAIAPSAPINFTGFAQPPSATAPTGFSGFGGQLTSSDRSNKQNAAATSSFSNFGLPVTNQTVKNAVESGFGAQQINNTVDKFAQQMTATQAISQSANKPVSTLPAFGAGDNLPAKEATVFSGFSTQSKPSIFTGFSAINSSNPTEKLETEGVIKVITPVAPAPSSDVDKAPTYQNSFSEHSVSTADDKARLSFTATNPTNSLTITSAACASADETKPAGSMLVTPSPSKPIETEKLTFSTCPNAFAMASSTPSSSAAPFGSVSTVTTTTVQTPITTPSANTRDNLFASLNICSPETKANLTKTSSANFFGGTQPLAFGNTTKIEDAQASLLATQAKEISTTLANLSGPSAVQVSASAPGITTTTASVFDFSSVFSSSLIKSTSTPTPGTNAPPTTSSTSFFGNFQAPTTSTDSTATLSMTTAATPTLGSPFSGSSLFSSAPQTTSTAAAVITTPMPFSGLAATPSTSTTSPFSGTSPNTTTASPFVATAPGTMSTGSPFPGAGLFASTAAANQSSFSSPSGGVFGAAGNSNTPTQPFGAANNSNVSANSESIFSGLSKPSAFGTGSGSSIFGGNASASPNTNFFGSPTAAATTKSSSIFSQQSPMSGAAGSSNMFGATAATAAAPVTANPFGTTTAIAAATPPPNVNLFASSAAASVPPANANPFGSSSGSFFGGSANNPNNTSGRSIFGGNSPSTPAFGTSSFASPSTAPSSFGGAGGAFSQGGTSVAGSGFSAQQQQPIFGGAPAFGSKPTFGAIPSFGGSTGFGSFANSGTTSPTFSGNAQGNSLFESLGSSSNSISFGNLAQSSPPNPPKPAFGGSSFMNYRS